VISAVPIEPPQQAGSDLAIAPGAVLQVPDDAQLVLPLIIFWNAATGHPQA